MEEKVRGGGGGEDEMRRWKRRGRWRGEGHDGEERGLRGVHATPSVRLLVIASQ